MNTHVFVVNSKTFKIHLEYLFAGTGAADKSSTFLLDPNVSFNASTERNLIGMIADISRIRRGDNIIFYLQASGNTPGTFFGVFKAVSIGFFDENDSDNYLKDELGKGLSFRIKISPKNVYSYGITEHEYLDNLVVKEHPYQLCWSLIYRKLKGNRGCTMITPFEYADLLKKLKQKNRQKTLPGNYYTYDSHTNQIISNDKTQNYEGRINNINILDRLLYKAHRHNAFETHLQAYILQNYDKSPFKDLFCLEDPKQVWIGNEVSCGVGMQRIDILIIETIGENTHIRIIELKDEEPYDYIIDSQLPWYLNWVSDYIVPNYTNVGKVVFLHPYIIAKHTSNKMRIDKIHSELSSIINNAKVCPTEYVSFDINSGIEFKRTI